MRYKFYTYIIFTHEDKVLEIGVTTDMKGTMQLMKEARAEEPKLVYYETFETGKDAADREKVFKGIPGHLLRHFVRENNPSLSDLSELIDH